MARYKTVYPRRQRDTDYRYRGFMPFIYVPLNAILIEPDVVDYSFIEERLAKFDRPAVIRLYLNYPGQPSGIPWFMERGPTYRDVLRGVDCTEPNYSDRVFVDGIKLAALKLAERYDYDPRIGFVEIGVFGQYGEWTTYQNGKSLLYPVEVQREVIGAFVDAFSNVPLLGRHAGISYDPTAVSVGGEFPIGYHDDMVPGQWRTVMMPSLERAGRADAWRTKPIGGEVDTRIRDKVLGEHWQLMKAMAADSHLTFLSPGIPRPRTAKTTGRPSKTELARLKILESMLGYSLRIAKARVPLCVEAADMVEISIVIANDGNAPFYRRWPAKLRVTGPCGYDRVVNSGLHACDVMPGQRVRVTFRASLHGSPGPGKYAAWFGMIGPENWIRFANDLDSVNGWYKLTDCEVTGGIEA